MIRFNNVSKYYYSTAGTEQALRKIQFELNKGEFVAITGESGSGKTTLLNLISGKDLADEGEIYIDGVDITTLDDTEMAEFRKNKIGFIYQNYDLIEDYSALANVEASLLILGISRKEAKIRALELLDKVGLKKLCSVRVAKLSSGQKQRIAIARALAKNTDIIIADEPTGNLDSESGKKIVELLSNLSKDRLVIMVTHNYEEAEPYVSRRIKLHEGEIVTNDELRTLEVPNGINNTSNNTVRKKSALSVALSFTGLNYKMKKRSGTLTFGFLFFIAICSFLFIGRIISNLDDTLTRVYDDKIFKNDSYTRVVVSRMDGEAITDDDMNELKSVDYVESTDSYDLCNDINYFINEGTDYEYTYALMDQNVTDMIDDEGMYSSDDDPVKSDVKSPQFLNYKKFMRSCSCLSEDDLASGRLPENKNEIVLYSDDESMLDKTINCYFKNTEVWESEFYQSDLTVTGLLKDSTDQVYFSEKFCNMMCASYNVVSTTYFYNFSRDYMKYIDSIKCFPVVDDELEGDTISYSYMDYGIRLKKYHDGEIHIVLYDNEGKTQDTETVVPVLVSDNNNLSSDTLIGFSEELFNRLIKYVSTQASVYVDDYAHVDAALNEIRDMGYNALSSYKVSLGEYDEELENSRLITIAESLGILILLGISEILIIKSFYKLKLKDYRIYSEMGMSIKSIKLINYFELWGYELAALLIIIASYYVLIRNNQNISINLLKFYSVDKVCSYIFYNYFVATITAYVLNRYLHKSIQV